MLQVGDYLYYHSNYGRYIQRTEILRETKTQWVIENDKRVKKEDLKRIGTSSFNIAFYKEETETLKDEYLTQGVFRKVLNSLDHMGSKRNHYVKSRLTVEKAEELRQMAEILKLELDKLLPEKDTY